MFPQDAQAIVDGVGLPEKTPQPSDELFDAALGEPLEAGNDEGIWRPVVSTLAGKGKS